MGFTHGGRNCRTKTYPMKCQYCGQSVFFFSCTHGSKIFFDALGSPWPQHNCVEYLKQRYAYTRQDTAQWGDFLQQRTTTPDHSLVELDGVSGQDSSNFGDRDREWDVKDIAYYMMAYKPQISDDTARLIAQSAPLNPSDPKKNPSYEIISQPPYKGNQREKVDGIVRELLTEVNPAKKLKVDSAGMMGLALLGELAKGKFAQITLYSGGLEQNMQDSFTFFIAHAKLKKLNVIKGDYVDVELRSIQIPGRDAVWICDDIQRAF